MERSERASPGEPGSFRSVPTRNLVRILSGEIPTPGHPRLNRQRPGAARPRPWSFWRELRRFVGLG